ncbi:MAG: T9SS type A sorting domain-containing protein [Candidatus Hatepunaea meridiana]|nr:T9SS type A sorting domain-containing protein [Candidatus Hatepunaea meridiana]
MEADDYEVIDNLTVTSGDMLTINPNTAFFLYEDALIKVYGGITANGWEEDERRICFTNFPGEDCWDCIYFYNPNRESTLDGCTILNGHYNVRLYDPSLPSASRVRVDRCYIGGSCSSNIRLYGPIQLICERTEITEAGFVGVYIAYNTPAQASQFNEVTITDNGTNQYECGVRVKSSNAVFNACEVSLNYGYGFYLYSDAIITLNEGPNFNTPNLVYNNGQSLDQNHDYLGAEIRVRNGSAPELGPTNLWDIDDEGQGEGDRLGKFISKDDTAPDALTLDGSHLGDGWHGAEDWDDEDDEMLQAHFWWDGAGELNTTNTSHLYLDDGPPIPDSFEDFEYARMLHEGGEYARAIDLYWRFIIDGDYTATKRIALVQLQSCYIGLNDDWDEFGSRCLQVAERNAEDQTYFGWSARKRACFAAFYDNRPERAIEELRSLLNEAPYPSDSLCVEMDILWIENTLEDHVDATGNGLARILVLEDMLETIDEGRESKLNPNVPMSFVFNPAYPNPFNSTTSLRFSMPQEALVEIKAYDLSGRYVNTVINKVRAAGEHQLNWTADDLPSGTYLIRFKASEFKTTQKVTLIR